MSIGPRQGLSPTGNRLSVPTAEAHLSVLSCSVPDRLSRRLCASVPTLLRSHLRAEPGVAAGAERPPEASAIQCPTVEQEELWKGRAPWLGRWKREYRGEAAQISKLAFPNKTRRPTFMTGYWETIDSGLLVVCSRKAAAHAVVVRFYGKSRRPANHTRLESG